MENRHATPRFVVRDQTVAIYWYMLFCIKWKLL